MIAAFDYRPTWERHRDEIEAALARVLSSGRLILGPEVEAFEVEFARYTGCAAAVGVGSGTDAILLALRALDIGPGDEVVTVANAGVPTIAAIRAAGALPKLVDVRPDTLLMNAEAAAEAIGEKTRCLLPVHLYGQPVDLDPLLRLASEHGLHVVEDCAQAHGARYREGHVGSFGDIGCFSFYPTKNLGAVGDGGACVTSDPALSSRLRAQRMYGYRGDRHAHEEGLNSRLDELQAAVLRVLLPHLDEAVEERRTLSARYSDGLDAKAYPQPARTPGAVSAPHLFVVQPTDRARVCEALACESIGFGIHYPEAVHRMEAYAFLGLDAGALPVSESACARVLSLPLYPGLDPRDVARVIDVLNGIFA